MHLILVGSVVKGRQCIFRISLLSPLGKGRASAFEQMWIPFIQGCFVRSFVEVGPVVLGNFFSKDINPFSLCRYYLPVEKSVPLPKDTLCQVGMNLVKWFWRRRWKCENTKDEQADDRWQATRKLTFKTV